MNPEQIAQINLINWFKFTYPDYEDDIYHFANERVCSIQQGRTLKKMGVKKGVADFFIAVPQKNKSGLWIELKVNGNKPTQEQKEFLARMTLRGFLAVCALSENDAKIIIKSYMDN